MLETPRFPATQPSRRAFLVRTSAVLAGALLPPLARAASPSPAGSGRKSLAFVNLHTGEDLDVTYWKGGGYVENAIRSINHLFRDYRTGEVLPIQRSLLDLLHDIRAELGTAEALELISGYRSPATNAHLRKMGRGVAKRSLHMVGKAADVRIPGTSLTDLRDTGLALRRGGVGYYAKEFVHIDVGRVRSW